MFYRIRSQSQPRRQFRVQDAVGSVLCHDITRIVPGESKGPVFRKGHVIAEEDIPVLLEVGKEHLYVYEALPGFVHEDDAARRIVNAAMGDNLVFSAPKEGGLTLWPTVTGCSWSMWNVCLR